MEVHSLILPNGGKIASGPEENPSIKKVTLTQKVNTEGALTCGSVFAACLEVTLLCDAEQVGICPGDRVELYRGEEKQGVFFVSSLEKSGVGLFRLTAFDSLQKLDKDLTGWLKSLSHWPYTLQELGGMVCQQCGLSLLEATLPNGEYPVEAFEGSDITGRMLLSWIGQATGRFCRATADGQVEFAWYTPTDILLEPAGENWYFRGSAKHQQEVAPIDRVQIRRDATDVGTVYPQDRGGENVYVVEGNPLLTAKNGQSLSGVAQSLYELLSPISYTPGAVAVSGELNILPGQIIQIRNREGALHTFYVMGRVRTAGKDSLSCEGVHSREQARVISRQELRSLSGKVLHLQMDIDGILAENVEENKALSRLEMDLDGIRTQVLRQQEASAGVKTQLSQLAQDSGKLSLRLSQIEQQGTHTVTTSTGYRFDGEGLWISKSGEEMENKLDNTGMYVRRSGQVILQANNRGVEAADVTVRNYLTIGDNARLEDYSSGTDAFRTACFFVGGNNAGI